MGKLAPTEFTAWLNLDKIVGREGGAIPRKYRELIALAVACTTQCPYCIEAHVKAPRPRAHHARKSLKARCLPPLCAPEERPHTAPWALKFYDQV